MITEYILKTICLGLLMTFSLSNVRSVTSIPLKRNVATASTAHCEGKADILLILDSSTSIGRTKYATQANFTANLTRNFHIGPDAIQFGAVLFSDNIRNLFDLNHFHTNDEIAQALIHMPFLTGSTHTALALDYARNTAFTVSHGARSNVGKIAIVITDGNSQNHAQTAQAAERLKNSGVKVIAVGVGISISHAELLAIASDEKDIFNVSDYSVLNEIKNALVTSACEAATTTPTPTTTTTTPTPTTTTTTTTTTATTTRTTTTTSHCPTPTAPANGKVVCEYSDEIFCTISCKDGFQFERTDAKYFQFPCDLATGVFDKVITPDCIHIARSTLVPPLG
ncbi:collagen alpha-6(VI) chain [Biomphalaria pfeifferi]|uniref:Collagen alpha-6(VI) chain n=1 Tax=Biomphalaria pfeifferi TaxID=112525 RepID=A0AAD8ATT6_BIOPF|nr:collagen alpha-6(VI) chain [Biomphalaria pfeifferi]